MKPISRRRFLRDVAVSAAYTREDLEAHKRRHPEAFAPLLSSGLAHEIEGMAGEALTEYEAILSFEPKNPWALYRAAAILAATGDPESALLFATALAREHPKYAAGHTLIAALHLAAGRRGKAREAARTAKLLERP